MAWNGLMILSIWIQSTLVLYQTGDIDLFIRLPVTICHFCVQLFPFLSNVDMFFSSIFPIFLVGGGWGGHTSIIFQRLLDEEGHKLPLQQTPPVSKYMRKCLISILSCFRLPVMSNFFVFLEVLCYLLKHVRPWISVEDEKVIVSLCIVIELEQSGWNKSLR